MSVRLYAVAFLAIGCLFYGGSGAALAGDRVAADDGYGQSEAPAADPDDADQPDAADDGSEAQPDDSAAAPDDEGAPPEDDAPQDDQPE
jgi:hypothetical protein